MTREEAFLTHNGPHVLMINNHGIHEWKIVPGLTDTGGQNIFVNQFTDCLAGLGFRITIVNRGGYLHPVTGIKQEGMDYGDDRRRILYLDDNVDSFIRKEDMHEQIDLLSDNLISFLREEGIPVEMIISHYWDGGVIGDRVKNGLNSDISHIWVPHSLGRVKQISTTDEQDAALRMEERISTEEKLLSGLSRVISTSGTIAASLANDYGWNSELLFIPPCIDTRRLYPREIGNDDPMWSLIDSLLPVPFRDRKNAVIISEISRTDTTKRKNILLRAFAPVCRNHPECLLLVTIDDGNHELALELKSLIHELEIENNVAVLGSVWDSLPSIYNRTDIYCSPSVMEGFGMSVQEAAACKTAVVASELIPFAVEYLTGPGKMVDTPAIEPGALIIKADDVAGFSNALERLVKDPTLRAGMGEAAYHRTIPFFTWERVVKNFLKAINKEGIEEGGE